MKIFLTGATGFVGGHLVDALLQRGHEVLALVRPQSQYQFLAKKGVQLIFGSLDRATTFELPDVDAVAHVAGVIKAKNAHHFYQVNAEGTRVLCEKLKNQKLKSLVLVSTISARGPNADREDTVGLGPVGAYGRSKLAGEGEVLRFKDQFPVCILRPPVVYGPRDRETLIFFKFFKKGFFLLPSPRQGRISMIHVFDLVQFIVAALENPPKHPGPYYPEDGAGGHTWDGILQMASVLYGKKIRLLRIPLAVTYLLACVNELLAKIFGFIPMLTREKVQEIRQRYWIGFSGEARQIFHINNPLPISQGFKEAREWYEKNGWV